MASEQAVERFIARWQGRVGGQERANYALFLSELTDALGVARPDPASAATEENDYVLERAVKEIGRDGAVSQRRIDLYRRSRFVLEAKQSRIPGTAKAPLGATAGPEPATRGRRSADKAWDVLMMNARNQAEHYVRWLPEGHEPPPFVIVCDVGHCLELYANFRKDGKAYDQFPDRQGYRIYLEDLRRPEIRERLVKVWNDPLALDPALHASRVTREIAVRLAEVSRRLEAKGHAAEDVAQFLMRMLFTMFAQDVELIGRGGFSALLADCEAAPGRFQPVVGQLWEAMDKGGYAFGLKAEVRRFNGAFFRDCSALPLDRTEIAELRAAASYDWREVEPAIFGALLEKALDPGERSALGAHYTPRAYVERLVVATVMEPLRVDWEAALATAERQRDEGRAAQALKTVRGFHARLCATRVLDPACGTGNFLYVTLELMKRLEGEVLEALADLGGQEALSGLEGHTVDPHQLLGLEKNPRAAAIAELALWIGYLQWHARTRGGAPNEPILKAFRNIMVVDAVLEAEEELVRDAAGRPLGDGPRERTRYRNPRLPSWPDAEFIVGNPPFIGGKDLRARLGADYAEALWAANPVINESADLVMHWWDRAAGILAQKGSPLRRFGFVTTNSISQVLQRRTLERRMAGRTPISIVMAIPDHPWTKAARDSAAVRIAMTVAEAGVRDGALREVVREEGLATDAPLIELSERRGRINADLTIGADVGAAKALFANAGLCHDGVKLHGKGFLVSEPEAVELGLGGVADLRRYIRPYSNGRDLTQRSRRLFAIDFFGLGFEDVRRRFPKVYQHLWLTVRAQRLEQHKASPTPDARQYLDEWWLFGKPRQETRPAMAGLRAKIGTVDTASHRVFQFLPVDMVCADKVVLIASDDASLLGALSSRFHRAWSDQAGGWLGVGNHAVYSKSRCFDPFPFPDPSPAQAARIAALAEELDAHRKRVLAERPKLTLTGLYNVLERLRAGAVPSDLTTPERRIFDEGLVLILKELHDRLDAAVADAYGWPADLPADEVVARLAALNLARRAEEARGVVRWLRPGYQAPRFARGRAAADDRARQTEAPLAAVAARKPSFPKEDMAQTAAVIFALLEAREPIDVGALADAFREGRRATPRIEATLAALARIGAVASAGATFALRGHA